MSEPLRIRQEHTELVDLLHELPYLDVQEIAEETGRHERRVRRQLTRLTDTRFVARYPEYREKGAGWRFVYVVRDAANPEKSGRMIPHERELTHFHRLLKHSTLELVHWEQRKTNLLDHVRDRNEQLAVNPDAFFGISDPNSEDANYFYLEIEKSRQAKYVRGESGLMRKVRAFSKYRESGIYKKQWQDLGVEDFRVIFVLASAERAENFLERLEDGYASRTFYVTYEDAYRADIAGRVFRTPKDWREGALYSLLD